MADDAIDPQLISLLKKLQEKYDVMGQDITSYLDGLLYSDYLTYWDYIHLDTLLSLQNPKTKFPDEKVFIVYHQITELYFKLILLEIEQISLRENIDERFFLEHIERIIRYFEQLKNSFSIMVDGMDRDQFLKFRMALLPASGFQSAQYRLIEICSTDLINLTDQSYRQQQAVESNLESLLEKLYWRKGATELSSGKKTLTLRQFENKYMRVFLDTATKYKSVNLQRIYLKHFANSEEIKSKLKVYDKLANIEWPLVHLKSASRYLHKPPEDIKATGGTNWQKYLPPNFQMIMFFPELWNDMEKQHWGRAAFQNLEP